MIQHTLRLVGASLHTLDRFGTGHHVLQDRGDSTLVLASEKY